MKKNERPTLSWGGGRDLSLITSYVRKDVI